MSNDTIIQLAKKYGADIVEKGEYHDIQYSPPDLGCITFPSENSLRLFAAEYFNSGKEAQKEKDIRIIRLSFATEINNYIDALEECLTKG